MDLKHLSLQRNKLSRLPITLGYLRRKIATLKLKDNLQFEMPPKEICDKGRLGIMTYLEERVKNGSPHKGAQLVLLGIGDSALDDALETLLSDCVAFSAPSLALSGISLHEWMPTTNLADGMTLQVCAIGADVLLANLYQFFLSPRATYVLAWRICGLEGLTPESPELRKEMEKTVHAITERLHDLYMRVPGISVLLVATHDGAAIEKADCQIQIVHEAAEALVERQQASLDDLMRCGNEQTVARPLHLFKKGESILINVRTGDGVKDCRRHIIRQVSALPTYGEIILPSFHRICEGTQYAECRHELDSLGEIC